MGDAAPLQAGDRIFGQYGQTLLALYGCCQAASAVRAKLTDCIRGSSKA